MAEEILPGTEPATPPTLGELPEQFEGGLLGGGAPAQRRLPERRLDIAGQAGTGPGVISGHGISRLVGTAGRRNVLLHGAQRGGSPTAGQINRAGFQQARGARQDPYRDALSYREDFGTVLSDKSHQQAVSGEKQFADYTGNVRGAIAQERQAVQENRGLVNTEYQKGQDMLNAQRDAAMKEIGPNVTLEGAWQETSSSFHPMRVWSGTMSNPGKQEAVYRAPVQYLQATFPEIVKAGYVVHNNNVYTSGRGQEIHDLGTRMQIQAKTDFYKQAGPGINEANKQLSQARQGVATQYSTAVNTLQGDYSNAMSTLAGREGAAAGREQGLTLEIRARQEQLAEVRQSYTDRLAKIDETMQGNVERAAASRSEVQPIRQIDPRMPGAQQQG